VREMLKVSRVFGVLLLALALFAVRAGAGSYPSNECASEKLEAAANRCDKLLKGWSIGAKTGKDRQRRIDQADRVFDAKWASAEEKAATEGVDCAEMTLSGAEMKALMDSAIDEIASEVADGLDLGVKKEANCGSKLLKSAATMCQKLLKAESGFIDDLSLDPEGASCDAAQEKAGSQFSSQWESTTRKECPTTATEEEVAEKLETLSEAVVTNVTVSPNVPDDAFMAITHPAVGEAGHAVAYQGDVIGPRCQDSSPYSFFARRGTENKLLMYYEGGGACWETLTCGAPLCKQDVDLDEYAGLTAPGGGFGGGFADPTHPSNPFKDWNIVYVPYCSCDVHWGDSAVDYPELVLIPGTLEFPAKHVEHRGYDNAKLAEKWVREHFVNPSDVFVTGSSAGAYGATIHSIPLNEVYPASSINMLGDAGNGVITQQFLEEQFGNWGVEQNLPDVPGISDVPTTQQSIPSIITAAARHYPKTRWAHYTAAYDGGTGGQTGFYHVMSYPGFFIVWEYWWDSSCAFNAAMRQQALDTEAAVSLENDNYRYYIASGSEHTAFGNPRVYDDTTGGVPPLADWVSAMIEGAPAWTSVEADPFNVLFPGECSSESDNPGSRCNLNADCPNGQCRGDDPKPDPLRPPFELVGSGPDASVVVNCQ